MPYKDSLSAGRRCLAGVSAINVMQPFRYCRFIFASPRERESEKESVSEGIRISTMKCSIFGAITRNTRWLSTDLDGVHELHLQRDQEKSYSLLLSLCVHDVSLCLSATLCSLRSLFQASSSSVVSWCLRRCTRFDICFRWWLKYTV